MGSTSRLAIFGLVIAYLVVGAGEAYLHWYAGTRNTPTARSLKEWYSRHDELNGKACHAGFVDLILPAIVLGLAAGCVTAQCAQRVLVWSVFILAMGVVGLFPLYAVWSPTKESDEWWRFASNGVRAAALIPGYFKAALLGLFFGALGRGLAQYFQGITSDIEDERQDGAG